MSSGIVHKKASLILSGGFLLGGILTLDILSIRYALGSLLGIIITPDWDVDAGFIMDKVIRNKFGKWAENLWDAFLYWYRRSLKHGSPLSHVPVISTYGRLAYTFFWIVIMPHIILYALFFHDWDLMKIFGWYWEKMQGIFWREILGLMGSDFIHWGLDVATTEHSENSKK